MCELGIKLRSKNTHGLENSKRLIMFVKVNSLIEITKLVSTNTRPLGSSTTEAYRLQMKTADNAETSLRMKAGLIIHVPSRPLVK